jgi:hypothetical protein
VLSLCYGWLPRGEDGLATPAALAVARTALLSGSALALAWLGGRPRWREAAWLVYPILVLGGLKLLIEDLGTGRTVSLALSFALYGLALIVAPRWVRRLESRRAPTGQDPTTPVG